MKRGAALLRIGLPALVIVGLACGEIRSADEPGPGTTEDGGSEPIDEGDGGGSSGALPPPDGSTKEDGAAPPPDGGDPCAATYPADAAPPDREWARWRLPESSPPAASYRVEQTVVCDRTTGLLWERNVGDLKTWDDGVTYCDTLSLGGYTDWRMPTRIELLSLVDFDKSVPAINTTAFPNALVDAGTQGGSQYWTSSPYQSQFLLRRVVSFDYGQATTASKNEKRAVRCVRGGL